MNSSRTELFAPSVKRMPVGKRNIVIKNPVAAKEEDLLLFHTQEYVKFVQKSSKVGTGFLDYGDTPSFKGIYEASLFPVGSSLFGFALIDELRFDHCFNPVGGLHHARRDRAGGFCVFNDAAIAISKALEKYSKIAYVDIDAHHGDGVFYGFESDPRVIIGDIHEDGRFLYPGTGYTSERGKGKAEGTKLNLPLPPGSADESFIEAFDKLYEFIAGSKPEFIFFQCGADGLEGDPISHLRYSSKAHAYAASKLHKLSHEICEGRILAMGGGGYNPKNVDSAWSAVVKELH
ncbi:MAG TPA: acetoin utilization protein AcuC [Nitrososphaerales archaeon]|nr:acetoin utilization protein AcuC [Nitrososphaerales archaeon]